MQTKLDDLDEATVFAEGFWDGLQPDPLLTVSEWADAYRFLSPKGGSEAGKFKTARTPYAREIMDCLSPMSPIREVVFMKGAQVGGSEIGNNWLGFIIDFAPSATLVIQPTVDLAKRFSKQRVDPLISETPRLMSKIKPARERDSGNTAQMKDFQGGMILLTGANSAVGLRSIPAKNIFMDEIDAWPGDVDGEGDPVALAEARTRTFSKKKILKVSTPTIEGRSKIAAAFNDSDQRYYHVPCPHCGQFQKLKMSNLKWTNHDATTAHYVCEFSGCEIQEHHKTVMLANGKWIAEKPGAGLGKIAGFHLSSLYSPVGWMSWVDVAAEWMKATKEGSMKLRAFVNTVLGETWKEKGEAPDWRRLYERREQYGLNTIPSGVYFLTAGTDIQKDRLESQIIGWGPDREAWVIDHRTFLGNPEDRGPAGPWTQHDQMLREVWTRPDERTMSIRLCAIDTGFLTQFAYDYVRRYPPNRVIGTKGFGHQQTIVGSPSIVDINLHGKRVKRGMRIWPVGVDHAKGELYATLKIDKPTDTELEESGYPPGFVHFPELNEEYFRQLTAEEIQTRVVKGFRRYEWVKIYERNEVLDTFILNRAAATVIGIDRFGDDAWENMLLDLGPIQSRDEQGAQEIERRGEGDTGLKRRKSTFL